MKLIIYSNFLLFLLNVLCLIFSNEAYKLNIITGLTDVSNGIGAPNIPVSLYKQVDVDNYTLINKLYSNEEGTIGNIAESDQLLSAGVYKLKYDVLSYFLSQNRQFFYPHIEVSFNVNDVNDTYLIVVLFDAYGFTTYRGGIAKKVGAVRN